MRALVQTQHVVSVRVGYGERFVVFVVNAVPIQVAVDREIGQSGFATIQRAVAVEVIELEAFDNAPPL